MRPHHSIIDVRSNNSTSTELNRTHTLIRTFRTFVYRHKCNRENKYLYLREVYINIGRHYQRILEKQ